MPNLLGSTAPLSHDLSDGVPFTLGTQFDPLVPLRMTHFRWYVPVTPQAGGADVEFTLWDNASQTILLNQAFNTAGFEDEFIEVPLTDGPYVLADDTVSGYTVSVWIPGRYVSTPFVTWADYGTPGVVTCPQPAGLYRFNVTDPTFPTDESGSSNYFADIVYDQNFGPTVSVWNGTSELPASISVWNGSVEIPASLSAIA